LDIAGYIVDVKVKE